MLKSAIAGLSIRMFIVALPRLGAQREPTLLKKYRFLTPPPHTGGTKIYHPPQRYFLHPLKRVFTTPLEKFRKYSYTPHSAPPRGYA